MQKKILLLLMNNDFRNIFATSFVFVLHLYSFLKCQVQYCFENQHERYFHNYHSRHILKICWNKYLAHAYNLWTVKFSLTTKTWNRFCSPFIFVSRPYFLSVHRILSTPLLLCISNTCRRTIYLPFIKCSVSPLLFFFLQCVTRNILIPS